MKKITIVPDGKRDYKALLDEKEIGRISYPKWFSTAAVLTVSGAEYTLAGRGFWKSVTELKKGERVLLEGRYKWKGLTITDPKRPNQGYTLKNKGFFQSGYVLADYKGNEVMSLDSVINWKNWKSSYTIICEDTFGSAEEDILLLLVTVHFYKMFQSMAASSSGTAATV